MPRSAREISGGAELTIDRDRDKNPVVALREIAEQTVRPENLKESVVSSLQRVLPDDDDEVDDIGSLSQSAEALRITAAAPVRNTSIGGDYDGMETGPVGAEDAAGYPALFAELARRGYSRADMQKIAGGNIERVLRAAEAYATAVIAEAIKANGIEAAQYQVALKQVEALTAVGQGAGKQMIIVPAQALDAFGDAFKMLKGRP